VSGAFSRAGTALTEAAARVTALASAAHDAPGRMGPHAAAELLAQTRELRVLAAARGMDTAELRRGEEFLEEILAAHAVGNPA